MLSFLLLFTAEWNLFGVPAEGWVLYDNAQVSAEKDDRYEAFTLTRYHAEWCGPCRSQEKELEGFPCKIVSINVDDDGDGVFSETARSAAVDRIPVCILSFREGGHVRRVRFTGLTKASTIKARMDSMLKKPAVASGVKQRWSVNGDMNASREKLIEHLSQENHGFSKEKLNAMTHSELIKLHDEDHDKKRTVVRPERTLFQFFQKRRPRRQRVTSGSKRRR